MLCHSQARSEKHALCEPRSRDRANTMVLLQNVGGDEAWCVSPPMGMVGRYWDPEWARRLDTGRACCMSTSGKSQVACSTRPAAALCISVVPHHSGLALVALSWLRLTLYRSRYHSPCILLEPDSSTQATSVVEAVTTITTTPTTYAFPNAGKRAASPMSTPG